MLFTSHMNFLPIFIAFITASSLFSSTDNFGTANAALIEEDRVKEYHARNYTWPPEKFHPDTPGWKKLMEHRLRQVAEIDDRGDRYEGYVQTLNAGLVAPNFTEHGFALARAPDELMEALRKGVRDGVAAGPALEPDVDVIDGDTPWFVDRPDLTERVLKELQHFPETWVGMELTAYRAYGFRLYRNNSQLHMHIDKTQTHVVSFILHIDSSEDAEPWPILIEDFHGSKFPEFQHLSIERENLRCSELCSFRTFNCTLIMLSVSVLILQTHTRLF